MSDDQLKEAFASMDSNGNGQLSQEEFGKAIFSALSPKGEEDQENGDDNDEEANEEWSPDYRQ